MLQLILNILTYYCIFAIATGITAYITVFRRIFNEMRVEKIPYNGFDTPILTSIVVIFCASILAPAILPFALFGVPEDFKKTYVDKIRSDKNIS